MVFVDSLAIPTSPNIVNVFVSCYILAVSFDTLNLHGALSVHSTSLFVFRGNQFEEAHAFIGYQRDTPAAVIFQATNQLRNLKQESEACHHLERAGILDKDALSVSKEGSTQWSEMVRCLLYSLPYYMLCHSSSMFNG